MRERTDPFPEAYRLDLNAPLACRIRSYRQIIMYYEKELTKREITRDTPLTLHSFLWNEIADNLDKFTVDAPKFIMLQTNWGEWLARDMATVIAHFLFEDTMSYLDKELIRRRPCVNDN